jgi:hypothetical protein
MKKVPVLGHHSTSIGPARMIACSVVFTGALLFVQTLRAQQKSSDPVKEFRQLAAQLSTARLDGNPDSQPLQDKALVILDGIASPLLDSTAQRDLGAVNAQLAALVAPTPGVGENYHFVRLGGTPASYALVVNLGLGGPAAVRIYSSGNGHFALAAKIDSVSQKDFFDSDIELISMSPGEPVFLTIAGRTDDLSTGMFSAWRFDGHQVMLLWNSDLLQESSYAIDSKGFHLTYCAEPDPDHPAQCPRMLTDLYQWQGGEWKRLESKDSVPTKPAKQ